MTLSNHTRLRRLVSTNQNFGIFYMPSVQLKKSTATPLETAILKLETFIPKTCSSRTKERLRWPTLCPGLMSPIPTPELLSICLLNKSKIFEPESGKAMYLNRTVSNSLLEWQCFPLEFLKRTLISMIVTTWHLTCLKPPNAWISGSRGKNIQRI